MEDADYRALVEDSPIAVIVVRDGLVRWTNRAAHRLLAAEPAAGTALADLVHAEDRLDVDNGLALAQRVDDGEPVPLAEWRFLGAGERAVTVEVVAASVRFEGERALALVCWDVSQHVERHRDLAHRATHDRLTGLPNRSLFEDRWSQARSRARRTGLVPLIAFCDVDDLKAVNDRHGHLAGDAVLLAVAQRLRAVAREEDTVSRFGGDEFVLLFDGPADVEPDALEARYARAVTGVEVELPAGGTVTVSCSVGLVVDDVEAGVTDVLARADARMYRAKRARRG